MNKIITGLVLGGLLSASLAMYPIKPVKAAEAPIVINIRWGHFVYRANQPIINFSGSAETNGGILKLKGTTAFDRKDYVSQVNPYRIDWVSYAGPQFDGLQLEFLPGKPDQVITIRIAGNSYSYTAYQLRALSQVFNLDSSGRKLEIKSASRQQFSNVQNNRSKIFPAFDSSGNKRRGDDSYRSRREDRR